jgi:hypothetical protein
MLWLHGASRQILAANVRFGQKQTLLEISAMSA